MDFDKILRISRRVVEVLERILLTPLSWLYGAGVWIRQQGFNSGLLKQEEFDVPVISVGNVTAGGTGKTPHM